MDICIDFEYELDNPDGPYYDVYLIVKNLTQEQLDGMEQAMFDFIKDGGTDGLDFDDQPVALMEKLGLELERPHGVVPKVDGYYILHIDKNID